MIEKVITIVSLQEDNDSRDVAYWLSRPHAERLAAVQILRQRLFDVPKPMEKILEVSDLTVNRAKRLT